MPKISQKERLKLDREHEKRKDRLRKQFPDIHGKLLDYVTHSYEDNWLYVNLYFTDGTNGRYVDGDYENLRTYFRRKDRD